MRQSTVAKKRHGDSALLLSAAGIADVVLARERLAESGASLLDAVDYHLKHAGAVKRTALIPALVETFLASCKEATPA